MEKITLQTGKGQLQLKKSRKLVGLKTTNPEKTVESLPDVAEKWLPRLGGFSVVSLNVDEQETDRKLDELRQDPEVSVGTHVYLAGERNRPVVPTGELYVVFESGASQEEQAVVLEEYGLELVERRSDEGIVVAVTAQSGNPIKVARKLQALSMVRFAEPDLDAPVDSYFLSPTDHLIGEQWHLHNSGQVRGRSHMMKAGADARIVDAWKRLGNLGSKEVTLAVIDNGFDVDHPDLKDKITRPFDLWSGTPSLPQGDPRFTHGTPCASVALASSNGKGIVGVAPNARFMPVNGTSFGIRATEQMFDYCVRNGADIISCSWGTTDPAFKPNAIKEAAIARAARQGRGGKGCVILFAAGNENLEYLNYYATHRDVIAVGACTSLDDHAYYSNRGMELDLVAPSNGHWPMIAARASWDPGDTRNSGSYRYWRDGVDRGGYYKHFGGTSCATPVVAGIVALMLSAHPELTAREVREILISTADKIGNPGEYVNGHSPKYGYGRVNAHKALSEVIRRRDYNTGVGTMPSGEDESIGIFKVSVEKKSAKGFAIQTGVFGEYENVLRQSEKMERLFGEPVMVQVVQKDGKALYRVLVGQKESEKEAKGLLHRMMRAGVPGLIRPLQLNRS